MRWIKGHGNLKGNLITDGAAKKSAGLRYTGRRLSNNLTLLVITEKIVFKFLSQDGMTLSRELLRYAEMETSKTIKH